MLNAGPTPFSFKHRSGTLKKINGTNAAITNLHWQKAEKPTEVRLFCW